jgi:hypothetical protein
VLSPQEVEGHWGYRLTGWLLAHGGQLLVPGLVVCVLLLAAAVASLWFMTGARVIAAGWVSSRFLEGLRHRGAPAGTPPSTRRTWRPRRGAAGGRGCCAGPGASARRAGSGRPPTCTT